MSKSLLFIPDISGFTQFVQSTEVEHSQHVIAELLEVLIDSNISGLELAEIEGDALFFYKEEDTLSQEKLLAQIEHTFSTFYSHLEELKKNRICQCMACATAPDLELKIVAHAGEIQFITVKGNRKPFGQHVIEAHRLLKNSVESDSYVLISHELADSVGLPTDYHSKIFRFEPSQNEYDGKTVYYSSAIIQTENLTLNPHQETFHKSFDSEPTFVFTKDLPVVAERVLEILSNYRYRHLWVPGMKSIEYNENEVTRVGTEHICFVDGSKLDFVTVSTDPRPGHLIYAEMTKSPPPVDEVVQVFYIAPLSESTCRLQSEVHLKAKSPLKKLALLLGVKGLLKKGIQKSLGNLEAFLIKDSLQKSKN